MLVSDILMDVNPLDALARRAFGLPKTAKGFLAKYQNPRPAGIVLRNCTHPLKPWPWDTLSDAEWAQEMRHNNWHLIAVLLRHPVIANDPSFISLFDHLESEYKARMKRAKWALPYMRRANQVDRILEPLRDALESLVKSFVTWATANRIAVWAALKEIASKPQFQSGNAQEDLDRIGKNW